MIVKRTTEVTFERVVRSTRPAESPSLTFCNSCGGSATMVAPEEAALAVSVSVRTIYRLVEEAKIHFRESAGGALVVCLGSIREHLVSP